jgi:hypothetical protein
MMAHYTFPQGDYKKTIRLGKQAQKPCHKLIRTKLKHAFNPSFINLKGLVRHI